MSLMSIVRRVLDRAARMDRMMARLQIRETIADRPDGPEVLRRAAVRYMSCAHDEECHFWLKTAPEEQSPPRFCRNRDLFDQLSRSRH